MKLFFFYFLLLFPSLFFAQTAGTPDSTFNRTGHVFTLLTEGELYPESVKVQPDGRILVGGVFAKLQGSDQFDMGVLRYTADGQLDTQFNQTGRVLFDVNGFNDICQQVSLQADGKILMVGSAIAPATIRDIALVRLHPDGSVDTSFGQQGVVTTDVNNRFESGRAVLVQPDGKLIVTGRIMEGTDQAECMTVRYLSDGSLDTSFGTNGMFSVKIPGTGVFISTFGLLQTDGKIVTGGFISKQPDSDLVLVRILPDGSLDPSFGDNGIVITDFNGASEAATGAVLQADGKIITATRIGPSGAYQFALLRYLMNGTLDPTFGTGGQQMIPLSNDSHEPTAIAIQADGKIVLSGYIAASPYALPVLTRHLPDGSLDPEFGNQGIVISDLGKGANPRSLAIAPNQKIVITGEALNSSTEFEVMVGRYLWEPKSVVGTKEVERDLLELVVYPNPVHGVFKIEYFLKRSSPVTISLFDSLGKLVKTLLENVGRQAGWRAEVLELGGGLEAGGYWLSLETEDGVKGVGIVVE